MSIDAMKLALEALEELADEVFAPYDNKLGDAILALRAAIEQAQTAPAKGGLAEKVPATGTHLETIVRKAFDQIYAEQDLERWADQEPVAWVNPKWLNPKTRHWTNDTILHKPIAGWVPLYTAPRQWQGLTDEEVSKLIDNEIGFNSCWGPEEQFARAIEAKLKEKNSD